MKKCDENDFFNGLEKAKKELITDINTLLKEFESKYKHIGINEFRHIRFNGADEDYTSFIRIVDVILYFSLEKNKDKKEKRDESEEYKRG